MAYSDLDPGEIEDGVVYVQLNELLKKTGKSRSTMWHHIRNDVVDALRFKNKTFFHPDQAEKYEKMAKAGLL